MTAHEVNGIRIPVFNLYFILFFNFTERDAFDTLFDHAPDKLNVVKKVRGCSWFAKDLHNYPTVLPLFWMQITW